MTQSTRLTAQLRTATGKGAARKLRAADLCPAVLYGRETEPVLLQMDPLAFSKVMARSGDNALIDLDIVDEAEKPVETKKVIVRDQQYHPLKQLPVHVDFYHLSMDRPIVVSVTLELTGTPKAVTEKAASVNQQVYSLEVSCLPADIPGKIELDISELQVGHALHVSSLDVAAGVSILDNPQLPVVALVPVQEEEEEEVPAEEAEAAGEAGEAEPEVIGKKAEGEEEAS